MGEKPKNLVEIVYNPPLIFNDEVVPFVEVDLTHINFGKDGKKRRSSFSWQQMAKIIEDILDREEFESIDDDETHVYFQIEFNLKEIPYKLIFCQDKKDFSLGIITFYRKG